MAVTEEHGKVEYSLEVLLNNLYYTSCAQCDTLEQAEGWYEATKFKFWFLGLVDSSIYTFMYDGNNACGFQIMYKKTLTMTCNSIANIKSRKGRVVPVSFDLQEDSDVIPLLKGEENLMLVLNSTCFFMDHFCPIHLCNKVITKLHVTDCNSVGTLQVALG